MGYTRECLLCHKKYEFCYCEQYENEPRWKMLFHDENCKTIFDTMQKHSINQLSDEEAISILEKCDLSVVENATESVKKHLSTILAKKTKPEIASPPVAAKKYKRTIKPKAISEN